MNTTAALPAQPKQRTRASRKKPKAAVGKCPACDGSGEISAPGRHAVRCQTCHGSGLAQQSENRQLDAFVFGMSSR